MPDTDRSEIKQLQRITRSVRFRRRNLLRRPRGTDRVISVSMTNTTTMPRRPGPSMSAGRMSIVFF